MPNTPLVDLSMGKEEARAETAEEPLHAGVRVLLVLVSVALLWLALPPVGLAPLALVALAPFLIALRGLSPRVALRVGLGFGYLSTAANAHWFLHVFPWYRAAIFWALLAIFPALYAALHAAFARRSAALLAVAAPAAWVAIDWFRSEGWQLKFAWFSLGHALAGSGLLRQNADIAGVYGLTLFCFLTSFLIERAFAFRKDGRALVLAIVVVAANLAFAARANRVLGFAPPADAPGSLRVLAVQDEHQGQLEPKSSLTVAAVASFAPDVILWPEDSFMDDYEKRRAAVEKIAVLSGRAFVFGSFRPIAGDAKHVHNAAVLLDPQGKRVGEYWKRVPVQFVESEVEAGSEPGLFSIGGARLGVMICYDGTYPFVTRDLARGGAEAILVPTWDMSEWGPIQHAHHALFYPLRACEVRKPIVRAASSGVTLAVDAWGRELGRIEGMEPGTLAVAIQPQDGETPYTRGGWLLPFAALAVALAGLARVVIPRP